jgi:hypothetical protein
VQLIFVNADALGEKYFFRNKTLHRFFLFVSSFLFFYSRGEYTKLQPIFPQKRFVTKKNLNERPHNPRRAKGVDSGQSRESRNLRSAGTFPTSSNPLPSMRAIAV